MIAVGSLPASIFSSSQQIFFSQMALQPSERAGAMSLRYESPITIISSAGKPIASTPKLKSRGSGLRMPTTDDSTMVLKYVSSENSLSTTGMFP